MHGIAYTCLGANKHLMIAYVVYLLAKGQWPHVFPRCIPFYWHKSINSSDIYGRHLKENGKCCSAMRVYVLREAVLDKNKIPLGLTAPLSNNAYDTQPNALDLTIQCHARSNVMG